MTKIQPRLLFLVSAVMVLCACAQPTSTPSSNTSPLPGGGSLLEAVYTVQAEGHRAVLRTITRASVCPTVQWGQESSFAAPQPMAVRVAPAVEPVRSGGAQSDSKAAAFPVLTCEADWPSAAAGQQSAKVWSPGDLQAYSAPAPARSIQRIVIIADTGCRMKASENAFQDCNDAHQWPFAQIARSAAAKQPDLVLHIGDIHYRESPCPPARDGCKDSPWGYGYDTWKADFFEPAKPLLAAAPWLFVRGNHESCARAGQGWFRFADSQPWQAARSCNRPELDGQADYSEPFTVPLGTTAQWVVFDSSKTPGKALAADDLSYQMYVSQMRKVSAASQARPNSFFVSHHPLLGFAPGKGDQLKPGNAGLQSAFSALEPSRLFPPGIALALHGHVHAFESVSFATPHPATLVLGNSGSQKEAGLPFSLPAGAQPYPGALVADFATHHDYGFATLDRIPGKDDTHWLLTAFRVDGTAILRCTLHDGKSLCQK